MIAFTLLKKAPFLSAFSLLLLACQAVALTEEVPNKPGSDAETYVRTPYTINDMGYFRTQDVYPDPRGELNLILSPEYDQSDDAGDFSLPLSLEYGITDHWLASIAFEVYRGHYPDEGNDGHGTGDIDIFTKYSFLYIGGSFTSAALTFNLHIPTGDIDRGLTDGFLRFEPSVLVAHDLPMRHWVNQVFGEVGIRFVDRIKNNPDPDDDDPAAHILVLNAGYVLRTARVNYLAEINWRNNEWNNNGDDNELYITPGLFVSATTALEVGGAISVGLTEEADTFRLLTQFIYAFELFDY